MKPVIRYALVMSGCLLWQASDLYAWLCYWLAIVFFIGFAFAGCEKWFDPPEHEEKMSGG